MSTRYQDIEERIQDALAAIEQRDDYTIAAVAREFDVPESRLRGRWKGRQSKVDRRGGNRKLSVEQEIAVCRYLDRLDKIGTSARLPMLSNCANILLRRSHIDENTPPPTVSEQWAKRFLADHLKYQKKRQKVLDAEKKECTSSSTYTRMV